MIKDKLNKDQINKVVEIFRNGNYQKVLEISDKLFSNYSIDPFLLNLKGMAEIKLNNFENSIKSFEEAIKINPDYIEAYNNLATTYINLGLFKKAISYLKKAILLKPDYANAYNNLASAQSDLGKYEDALESFNTLLKIKPNYPGVSHNIIKTLTFFNPKNKRLNIYTELNESIKNLNTSNEINEKNIINFYKKCQNIVSDKLDNINFNFSQIWRRNNIDLNCSRHFDVFNNFKVIPKFCFSCFKIQISLKSLVELFKLYFVFDKIIFDKNKSRKCLVELRKIGKGSYKGLIYCSSINEANEIYKLILHITKKNYLKDIIVKIKRGCTEFGNAYPNYKDINSSSDKFMQYNENWKIKENIIDNKLPKHNRINQRILNDTISGKTLNDFLIMKNWVMYAKAIGDDNYKKFDSNITISDYMKNSLAEQIDFRKKEYKSNFELLSKR